MKPKFKTGTLIYSTRTGMVWRVKSLRNDIYRLQLISNPTNGYKIGEIGGFTSERTHNCCVVLTEDMKAQVV